MPTTLIAVCGMSPAIVTETLWALACGEVPVVPDEVIAITTRRGREDIERQLLTAAPGWKGKTVWQSLRRDILKRAKLAADSRALQLDVRVITLPDAATGVRREAEDIRTRDDSTQAADCIVQVLSPLTDAQDQRVIASIAGGRKTMGALLYGAMSLLGRETDRCTHVLVSDPFDTVRGFYYPEQPVQALEARPFGGTAVAVRARDARIGLADIPFVPLRNKFAELNERRTFAGLVETYSKAPRRVTGPPRVTLDEAAGILTVDGREIKLRGRNLLIAAFLMRRARDGQPHLANKEMAKQPLAEFNAAWKREFPFHRATNRLSANGVSEDDIPKALAELRRELRDSGLESAIPYLAPERMRIGFDIADL